MDPRSVLERNLSRRKLLVAAGGLAGVASIGYSHVQSAAKEGTITARFVIGDERDNSGTVINSTRILAVIGHIDSPPIRHFHPDYRQQFPAQPPMTVSASLHRALQNDFDDVGYTLNHTCPNAECSAPQVSRRNFNGAKMGEEVRLFYHSDTQATVVP